jgi:IclR family transcriptional regulator, KDG regulon repressor
METTVVKGLRMLEALAMHDGPCALTDVARLCGVTKSNAHRLLKTLEECRYVRQDPKSRAYEPTLRLWELGMRVFNRLNLRALAHPHLQVLAKATRESVHLAMYEHGEVIYVDKVESPHAVRAYIGVGDRAPAYCTATGKAILAFMPADVIDRAAQNLKRYTPNTITDPRKLKAELARIRERGYSITGGEWRPGVLGVAAPVKSPAGAVVAGIGIAGPEDRMREADVAAQAAAVIAAAEGISGELGFAGTDVPAREEAPAKRRSAAAARRATPRRHS